MRRILDGIYLYCGALAALFLSLIAVTILAQIVGRLFAITIDSVESSGFCLAATTFLGLAHTLKSGQHIQINLFIRHLKGRAAQAAQLWCCGVAGITIAFFSWEAFWLTVESYQYKELSPGLLALPIWIPQTGMTVGLVVLAIGFFDEFWIALRGGTPAYAGEAEGALSDMPDGDTH